VFWLAQYSKKHQADGIQVEKTIDTERHIFMHIGIIPRSGPENLSLVIGYLLLVIEIINNQSPMIINWGRRYAQLLILLRITADLPQYHFFLRKGCTATFNRLKGSTRIATLKK
jgi:hypothetical protein